MSTSQGVADVLGFYEPRLAPLLQPFINLDCKDLLDADAMWKATHKRSRSIDFRSFAINALWRLPETQHNPAGEADCERSVVSESTTYADSPTKDSEFTDSPDSGSSCLTLVTETMDRSTTSFGERNSPARRPRRRALGDVHVGNHNVAQRRASPKRSMFLARLEAGSALGDENSEGSTLMVRNVPPSVTQDDLLATLVEQGIGDDVALIYLPHIVDAKEPTHKGFAYVHITRQVSVDFIYKHWQDEYVFGQGFRLRPLNIAPARVQGFSANLALWKKGNTQRIRNHAFRPLILHSVA